MSVAPEVPAGPLAVLRQLQAAGYEAYLVGGCVRDRLIDRAVNDWDVATNALPEQVVATFRKTIPTGLQHGTVTVVEAGEPIEVTTYRVEIGYSDGRRPDEVRFTRRLEDDLSRRDFTINAMAWDPVADTLIDPFEGQRDLAARCLRAVGTARGRFDEDGLRAMRAVRFAAVLDFEIEPATWSAIPDTLDTFAKVAIERVQIELAKLLRSSRAGWGLGALRRSGLMGVFLPALAALPDATFDASCAAVDAVEGELRRLTAALWGLPPGGAEAAARHLRFGNDVIRGVGRLHALRPVAPDPGLSDAEVRARVALVGRDALDDWLAVGRAADVAGGVGGAQWDAFSQRIEATGARACALTAKELALDGRAVMAALQMKPSRRLGAVLEALLRRVWADPTVNTEAGLLAILAQVADEVPG